MVLCFCFEYDEGHRFCVVLKTLPGADEDVVKKTPRDEDDVCAFVNEISRF